MRRFPFRVGGCCLLAMFAAAPVIAQETQQEPQTQQERPFQLRQQGQEAQQNQADPFQQQADPAQRSALRPSLDQQGQIPVREALVKKLQKGNQAEIEIAQMAQERIDQPEIKQYIQTVIQDHQALNQQLNQVASGSSGRSGVGSQPGQNRSQESRAQQDRAQQGLGQPGAADQLNRNQTAQRQSNQGQQGQQQAQRGQQGRQWQGGGQEQMVPSQMVSLMEQACQNKLEMTKEMLSGYEGQDFQMGFLGQQIVAHIAELAELKAISNQGPQELQQIAQQATQKVQNHLEQAKQLARKFEDRESSGQARAEQSETLRR